MDDYRRLLTGRRQADRAARRAERVANGDSSPAASSNRKDQRRAAAEARAAQAPLRKAARAAELRLESLQEEKKALDELLADPSLYNRDGDDLTAIARKAAELERAIDSAEMAWLEAQEALESSSDRP